MLAEEPLRLTSSRTAGVRKGLMIKLTEAMVRENLIVLVSRSQGPQITRLMKSFKMLNTYRYMSTSACTGRSSDKQRTSSMMMNTFVHTLQDTKEKD